jgi:hypothetical protein
MVADVASGAMAKGAAGGAGSTSDEGGTRSEAAGPEMARGSAESEGSTKLRWVSEGSEAAATGIQGRNAEASQIQEAAPAKATANHTIRKSARQSRSGMRLAVTGALSWRHRNWCPIHSWLVMPSFSNAGDVNRGKEP